MAGESVEEIIEEVRGLPEGTTPVEVGGKETSTRYIDIEGTRHVYEITSIRKEKGIRVVSYGERRNFPLTDLRA